MLQASGKNDSVKVACFGRLAVRCIYHILGKEKLSKEPKGHADIAAIVNLSGRELQGVEVEPPEPAEASPSQHEMKVHNLLDADPSQVALVKNPHMVLGEQRLKLRKCKSLLRS